MEMYGQIGERRKVRLNNFLRATLVAWAFGMSVPANAGDVQWSINLGWLFGVPHGHYPPPGHGHGHGHGHTPVHCGEYYLSHGCNIYGYNCARLPHSKCVNGQFVGPYVPPYYDHRGTVHQHNWRCNTPHWHEHYSHTHHTDGHHHFHGDR